MSRLHRTDLARRALRALAIAATALLGPLLVGGSAHAQSCSDSCASAYDGSCDDGGPGAANSRCALGTDCGDCGTRFCNNSCTYAYDNECDDGGPGSVTAVCDYGTDCGDCGPR